MTTRTDRKKLRWQSSLVWMICAGLLLGGCSSSSEKSAAGQNQPSVAATTNATENSAKTGEETPAMGDSIVLNLPEGVTVLRVIKDVKINNNQRKRVEQLSDGGKRVVISDANDNVLVYYIEYEGLITAVNGNEITVQVKYGNEQKLVIPSGLVIEDDDNLGLNVGVKVEWEVDANGQIIDMELDD